MCAHAVSTTRCARPDVLPRNELKRPALPSQRFIDLFARRPAILAPMEDVTDAVFRRLCRGVGAELCLTEFVNVEGLLRGCRNARRKATLAPGDEPTAIQIYGSDPERLEEAARVAEAAGPAFIDINCGCWVPKIAARGAGAGWLRDPTAMVTMAARVVRAVSLPVTVKTRIGWGPESHMPIVDLAPRLEDAGVAALTVHCRTANMGHSGPADWTWAARAAERVKIPVVVNGDIRGVAEADKALNETGCAGVMVGRRAIEHPWVFREIRAWLDDGVSIAPPSAAERFAMCRAHLSANVEARGEHFGVRVTRRHLAGYLKGLPGAAALRQRLLVEDSLARCLDILAAAEEMLSQPSYTSSCSMRLSTQSKSPDVTLARQ
jgi:tRNA-dihydrouridine synthase B